MTETAPGETTRRRDPDATRELILDAAQSLAAEEGPGSLTVSGVARSAGVNRGTAYLHFPTKSDLMSALAARLSADIGDDIRAIFDLGSVDEQIDAFGAYFRENPEQCRNWLYQLLGDGEDAASTEESNGATATLVELFGALAESDVSYNEIDSEALAMIILGGGLLWMVRTHQQNRDPERLEEEFARFMRELKRLMVQGVLRPGALPDVERAVAETAN